MAKYCLNSHLRPQNGFCLNNLGFFDNMTWKFRQKKERNKRIQHNFRELLELYGLKIPNQW